MRCRQYSTCLAVVVCVTCAGCMSDAVFEGEGLTYQKYRQSTLTDQIDPVGATDIDYRTVSDMDTSDRWLAFTMAEDEFKTLVAGIAESESGPDPLEWMSSVDMPQNWTARLSAPSWWPPRTSGDSICVHWCYPANEHTHYGWYWCYDRDTERAYCWHWRYQWAGEMCE